MLKSKRMPKIKITPSSGNVFADMGVPNPEEALAKSDIARAVNRLIAERGLTQTQTAAILGIDQPRVCALVKGRLTLFSLKKLLSFVAKLGSGVEIKLGSATTGITVVCEPLPANPCHGQIYGAPVLVYAAGAGVSATMEIKASAIRSGIL